MIYLILIWTIIYIGILVYEVWKESNNQTHYRVWRSDVDPQFKANMERLRKMIERED